MAPGSTIPFPSDPYSVQLPTPDPGGQPDTPDAAYSVLPDAQVPTTPVVVVSTPYHEYAISKTVFDWSGLVTEAVQGPPGTPADVVRTCAPYGRMVVHWFSRSRVGPPLVPSRDLQDANAVYKRGWVRLPGPGFFSGGSKAIEREGCYFYDLQLPYAETDTIVIAAFPFTNENVSANALKPTEYSKTIIGPNTPPAGAPTTAPNF